MPILFTLGLEHALVVPFHGSEFVTWSFNPSLHRVIKKEEEEKRPLWPTCDILPSLVFTRKNNTGTMNHFTPDFPSISNTCLSHVALPLCICKTAHLRPISCSPYQRVLTAAPLHGDRGPCFQVEWTQSGWHSKHLTKCREKKKMIQTQRVYKRRALSHSEHN